MLVIIILIFQPYYITPLMMVVFIILPLALLCYDCYVSTCLYSSYDGCTNTCLQDEKVSTRLEQKNQEPSSPQQPSRVTVTTEEVIKVVTEPLPTTYRPVFITPSEGYTYSTPPPLLQMIFDKPSTPPPGLPVLYGPPTQSS